MNRGDVFWAELVPRSGSEQSGRRPVVVISHDAFNRTPAWRSIIVVPLTTSAAQARRSLTVLDVSGSIPGLARKSYAICHQITTLDRSKLTTRLGALAPQVIREIEDGIKAAVDL